MSNQKKRNFYPAGKKIPASKKTSATSSAPRRVLGEDIFGQYPDGRWATSARATIWKAGSLLTIADPELGVYVLSGAEFRTSDHAVIGGKIVESYTRPVRAEA